MTGAATAAVTPAIAHIETSTSDIPAQYVVSDPAIETRELTKSFGEILAVKSLDLAIETGTIFGLLGPNGAGKTTTIRMLTTLLPPTSGVALVAGYDVTHEAEMVRRSIGYVPQLLSTDGTLTGYENLLVSARLYHLPRGERRDLIHSALEDFGLFDARDRLVRTYSGGMIRRLEMAAAMLHQPRVLFLDEPTLGLDPIARETVWDHLRALQDSTNTTVLLTTHYMEEADELCDRIAIMHRGEIAGEGSPAELKSQLGPDATLEDVFTHLAGGNLETGGGYGEVARARRTARRVG